MRKSRPVVYATLSLCPHGYDQEQTWYVSDAVPCSLLSE